MRIFLVGVIYLFHLGLGNPSEFEYQGQIVYSTKPYQIRKAENADKAVVLFYYDAHCQKSIKNKDFLHQFHSQHPILGKKHFVCECFIVVL